MNYVIQFVVAMAATISFAILFSAPRKELLYCGISGALGWIVYCIMTGSGMNVAAASLAGTLLLTIFSRAMAVIRRMPVTVYLISGIFPLVPGAGIYYTAYYLIQGDNERCSEYGVSTLLISLAITFGIIFGSAIPQKVFRRFRIEMR